MQRLSFGDNKNIQRPFDLLQLRLTYSAGNYCNKFHCQPFTAKMKTVGFPITNMQTTPFHPMTWITNIFAIREVVQKMETFMAFSIHGWGKGGGWDSRLQFIFVFFPFFGLTALQCSRKIFSLWHRTIWWQTQTLSVGLLSSLYWKRFCWYLGLPSNKTERSLCCCKTVQ